MRDLAVDDSHLKRIEAIINSMTGEERRNPDIIGVRANAGLPQAQEQACRM